MPLVTTKKELEQLLQEFDQNDPLGLVPTMGALHQGHASLIKKAVEENTNVVVTIFVNPTQFDNAEDLEKYPQTLADDEQLIHSISNKIVIFAPAVREMYNTQMGSETYDFEGLDTVMEGAFRNNHFNGVGTIVEKILKLVQPTNAYFGEKDFQQLRIIQKLTEIKHIDVNIIGCEIVREKHGLAMSSRNERLTKTMRLKAGFIYQTLQTAKTKFGTKSVTDLKEWVVKEFLQHTDLKLEYFEISDVATLTPAKKIKDNTKYRAFIAVYADTIRLIDNIALN